MEKIYTHGLQIRAIGSLKQRYTEGYRITTTKDQDSIMKKNVKSRTISGHNFVTNNCTVLPRVALNSIGLNDGEISNDGPFGLGFWELFTFI